MEVVVSNVEHIYFDIERLLEMQVGAQLLPFAGMDSKSILKLFVKFSNFGRIC